jgi:hypothetical protein
LLAHLSDACGSLRKLSGQAASVIFFFIVYCRKHRVIRGGVIGVLNPERLGLWVSLERFGDSEVTSSIDLIVFRAQPVGK